MSLKEVKKKDIAASARELFTDFGYKSVSMEQIAQKANVAKGTVYLYFKDKADLFNYLVQEFLQEMQAMMEEYESRKLSFFDEVHEVVYNLLMYRRNQKFIFRAAKEAKEFKTPASLKVLQQVDNVITGYLERRLQKAIDDSLIKPCNPSVLAFVIIRVYSALAFEWEEEHEPLNEKEIAQNVKMFFTDGLMMKSPLPG